MIGDDTMATLPRTIEQVKRAIDRLTVARLYERAFDELRYPRRFPV